jgi:HAD superfamily hydrolase (TIGR01490 family)
VTMRRPGDRGGAPRLALFDLDHTLLSGDSDVLWCEFLIAEGLLDRAEFEPRNRAMAERYANGLASPAEFCGFYAQTLAGARPDGWQDLRSRFLRAVIAPRIPAAARALVARHREGGDRVILTTATNRFLVELTASELGIADLLATEVEVVDGMFTGRNTGILNMRDGKVARLHDWLRTQGLEPSALADATFYSDSSNDLPLLLAVGYPVAVDPDERLAGCARERGWPVLHLDR